MEVKQEYSCKCGEFIKQIYSIKKENVHWLLKILSFYDMHKRHGFEL